MAFLGDFSNTVFRFKDRKGPLTPAASRKRNTPPLDQTDLETALWVSRYSSKRLSTALS